MKRIYLLLLLLATVIGSTYAQQKDLELLTFNRNPDTIKYNAAANGGPFVRYVYAWGFRNAGNVAFTPSDTIKFRSWTRNNATLNLRLPATGIPVGDTVYYFDTIGWVNGPKGNFLMCDSAWSKNGATINPEPTGNNKKCRTVYWMQDPLSVSDFEATAPAVVVYPNPAKGILNLKYNYGNNATAKVVITNLLGSVVYSKDLGKNLHGMQEIPLDISNLKPGLHLVQLTVNDEKKTAKIMVGK